MIFHVNNIKDSKKLYTFKNIEFETISTSIKKSFFHQHIMIFLNKIELIYQKYQTNGTVGDKIIRDISY